jgi:hypothetical protein
MRCKLFIYNGLTDKDLIELQQDDMRHLYMDDIIDLLLHGIINLP